MERTSAGLVVISTEDFTSERFTIRKQTNDFLNVKRVEQTCTLIRMTGSRIDKVARDNTPLTKRSFGKFRKIWNGNLLLIHKPNKNYLFIYRIRRRRRNGLLSWKRKNTVMILVSLVLVNWRYNLTQFPANSTNVMKRFY